ncbi:MAG: hypothetical protein HY329_21930 [Chloroflexi bacterium]|nr:hypothetical protein [Chloroflexota bacterium]
MAERNAKLPAMESRTSGGGRRRSRLGFTPTRSTGLLFGIAFLLMLTGAAVQTSTIAYFTETATSTNNTFTTGAIDIKLTDSNETSQAAVTGSLTFSGMIPGDFRAQPLTVVNPGTEAYSYTATGAITTTGTSPNTLSEHLSFVVSTAPSAAACSGATAATFGTIGTNIYSGTLSGATNPVNTERGVAGGASELLCLQAYLPTDKTTTQVANKSANIDLTFTAIQARNR